MDNRYLSDEEIKLKLENLLKEGLKKDNLIIDDDTFKLGLNYYFQELKDLSKKCVFGLSIKETLVVREKLGINNDRKELTFEEIKRNCGILDIGGIFNYSMMMLRRNIKNINMIFEKEFKEEPKIYKTLLGELNLSKKTFGLLQSYNIYTLGDLISYSKKELSKLKNIGKSNLNEIISAVHSYGFQLKDEEIIPSEEMISLDNKNEEELERISQEEVARKKRDLELEKLKIRHQRITIYIEELLKEQKQIEEEIEKIISDSKLKK